MTKNQLNFTDSFRPRAESLLKSELASGRLEKMEEMKLQCALSTRTESEAISFANTLAKGILSGKLAIDHLLIERVSSEIDWWDAEIFAYSGEKVIAKFASDHLVAMAIVFGERNVLIVDTCLGIFPD